VTVRSLLGLALSACLLAAPLAQAADKAPVSIHPAHTTTAQAPEPQGDGGLDFADQKGGTPLEIYADQGLELSQDAKTVIGRVNAKAIRGHVTVTADVLTAHYRDKQAGVGQPPAPQPPFTTKPPLPPHSPAAGQPPVPPQPSAVAAPKEVRPKTGDQATDSGSEVWWVEADGTVSIAGETQTAYGDHADYNIDDAVVVLTGKALKFLTPTDVVTARDSLEYWERRQQAVARGNAVAVRGDKRIQADVLVADFARNADHQMAMQHAHAFDHVILTTPREVVTGDRGDYNVETGIVTVTGSVKITREDNQLDGGYAVVNLNTGVSRLFPAAPGAAGSSDRRVKGLFIPQKKQPDRPDAATGTR